MEKRKVIKFGKSAFCMTLPNVWMRRNKLAKGSMLGVRETNRNTLELYPRASPRDENHESITIDIKEKSVDEIIQHVVASYLNGYITIILKGPTAGKVGSIRQAMNEFIAAEIMEATSTRIIVHVFWDTKTIELDTIILRIGNIIKNLFAETIDLLDKKADLWDMIQKAHETRRQVLLARRAVKYSVNHAPLAQRFDLTPLDIIYISNINQLFGKICDDIMEIANIISVQRLDKKLGPRSRRQLTEILRRLSEYYDRILQAFQNTDSHVRLIMDEFGMFTEKINELREKHPDHDVPLLCERLKMLTYNVKEAQFQVMAMGNAPE